MTLLFKLLIGHAVADFALQSDVMAKGKNRHSPLLKVPPGAKPAVHWYYWMAAHSLIHAGAVLVVLGSGPIGLICAGAELVSHFVFDCMKCENVTNIHSDQGLHIAAKMVYALIAGLS